MVVVPPVCSVDGGGVVNEIVMAGPLIVTFTLINLVVSVFDVAVIVTLPPVGAVAGAVYVVAALLRVIVGLKLPQVPAGVQLQVTPPFAVSFVTAAVRLAVAEADNVVGGVPTNETEMGKVTEAAADLVASLTDVAVIVTLPPVGGVVGAV
jgi:hypothetical protein